MDTQKILCPHCHKEFNLNEGMTHQLKESYKAEYDEENKHKIEEITLNLQRKAQEEAEKKLSSQSEEKFKQLREERDRAQENERKLLKDKESFDDERRKFEIEKDRREVEIKEEARRKTESEYDLKIKDKDLKLENALRQVDEMRRKLEQGSQQSQGEVLELEVEQLLRREFPIDEIREVPKGRRGADVLQVVKDSMGRQAGIICWESKRTKDWSAGWISKLKEDKRATNANESVLVSVILPEGVSDFDIRDGVYLTSFESLLTVAKILRQKIIAEIMLKQSVGHDNEKLQLLHDYLMGPEFKGKIESLLEIGAGMQADLEKEKRIYTSAWRAREEKINKLINSTVGVHGSFQGILGNDMQQIEELSMESLIEPEQDNLI